MCMQSRRACALIPRGDIDYIRRPVAETAATTKDPDISTAVCLASDSISFYRLYRPRRWAFYASARDDRSNPYRLRGAASLCARAPQASVPNGRSRCPRGSVRSK